MCFIYVGESPTNLMVAQVGPLSLSVSWTAPSSPPSTGYRIVANPGGLSADTASTSYTITFPQPGVCSVSVTSLSQHFPGGTAGPVEVTIRGMEIRTFVVSAA